MRKTTSPIEADDLSLAWAKAFVRAFDSPGGSLSRLMVTTTIPAGGVPTETLEVRSALADALEEESETPIETVANTIFPNSLWNPEKPAKDLFDRYDRAWPRIHRCHANSNGVYFRRLTAFGDDTDKGNQLQHVIRTWRDFGNHRHSALQAAIFNPAKDHNNSQQHGFPCLHQISFDAQGTNGTDGLIVTGYYATQHLFEKAYGNYLGLARLGQFMAHEMGLHLVGVTCIASVAKAKATDRSKKSLEPLAAKLREHVV